MIVKIKKIRDCGSYKVWETEVLGRHVEVLKRESNDPKLLDLALIFALRDCDVSSDEFIKPVVNAAEGDELIIPSIPLSVTMNFCNRKLCASFTLLLGSSLRKLDAYVLITRYGKRRVERLIQKISERSERRLNRIQEVGDCNCSLVKQTRAERKLTSALLYSLSVESL